MYTDYDSLPNCSGDEDVFGDASHGKAQTKHGHSGEMGELRPVCWFDYVDTWELLSRECVLS